jgi:hypothetical protein
VKPSDYEFMMKVFNSPVENRVEKHQSKSKSVARKGLCALCTIIVQLFLRRENFSRLHASIRRRDAMEGPKQKKKIETSPVSTSARAAQV